MAKRCEKVDYSEISCEHKKLVRRLVSPRATADDWEMFYSIIRPRVTKQYTAWLYENPDSTAPRISVDDFMRGELTTFLLANKSERLRQFLNLKSENSDHQHLFGTWFSKVVRSALDIAMPDNGGKTISGDAEVKRAKGNGKDNDKAGTVLDTISSEDIFDFGRDKESIALAKLLRHVGGNVFSKIIGKFWGKNPQETYIAIMDAQLNFRYRKIAALVGREEKSIKNDKERKKEEISIAGKLRNLHRKLFGKLSLNDLERMFPALKNCSDEKIHSIFSSSIAQQGEANFFGADGEADVDLIEQMGAALGTMYFKDVRGAWQLELKLPFEVSDKTLIRGVLSDGKGGIPQGTLFCCGKKRKIRANGHFEFPVSEFKKFSDSSELYFIPVKGKQTNGIPYVPEEFDVLRPTPELLEAWAARKMSDSNPMELTADLLDDFGYVLPQLLLKDEVLSSLPFDRFGVPLIDRKNLRREYNEAWVLFRAVPSIDSDSPLSADGFMLPLEWRYNPYAASLPCNLLPLHLSLLSRRVLLTINETVNDSEECKQARWQLNPSIRFFDDRVDFSVPGLLGRCESDVASATGALAVALIYAQNDVHYVGWPFISLKYDFAEKRPQGVGGIGQKLALTASFGGRSLAISPDQEGVSSKGRDVEVRAVTERTLREIAEDVAFYHLRSLQPSNKVQFKSVDPEILAPRRKLARKLFELANDEDVLNDTGTFVVLFGGPGMGKSVLMWLLRERCTTSHRAIGYVCQAGRANQGWEFVKSLAYGIASTFGEETGELLSVDIPDAPPKGDSLRNAYRNLVVNPLRRISGRFNKKEKLFVLVDGLDEDATGVVADLLLDGDLKLPPKIAVVVSSRHIVQDEDRLESVATEILDLDEQDTECARDVRMDVRTYIDQWLLTNESVNDWLMRESLASEEVKDAILDKDRSFLYASYVLSGIADGRYGVRKEWDKPITITYFAENLPADLKTCFYDAFKARFPDSRSYGKVKTLLRQLVRKGRIGEADASRKVVVGEETLGAVLKALRGYAVVTDGEISLSSEALRMWLRDSTHNAEFGV